MGVKWFGHFRLLPTTMFTVKPVLRDYWHERTPVLKDHIFLPEGPIPQHTRTSHQIPPVLRDHTFINHVYGWCISTESSTVLDLYGTGETAGWDKLGTDMLKVFNSMGLRFRLSYHANICIGERKMQFLYMRTSTQWQRHLAVMIEHKSGVRNNYVWNTPKA